jgi:hypothetical protein
MYVKVRGYRYQHGFIDVILYGALFVFSVMTWLLYQQDLERFKDDSANQAGVYAAQFKHALQSKLSQDGVGIATGTFAGTAWLKDSATCTSGTGTMQHLPCTFPDTIAFGLSYSTTVSVAGGIATLQTSLGAPVYRGDVKPSISGRIVAAINGANSAYSTPITQVYFVANHNLVTGAITMTVTNSQNLDYLKPDGSVLPTANFDWNNYDISNVRTLNAETISTTGDITAAGDITSAGQTVSQSYIFSSSVSVGSACSGRQINVDSTGNVVSCVSGLWSVSSPSISIGPGLQQAVTRGVVSMQIYFDTLGVYRSYIGNYTHCLPESEILRNHSGVAPTGGHIAGYPQQGRDGIQKIGASWYFYYHLDSSGGNGGYSFYVSQYYACYQ